MSLSLGAQDVKFVIDNPDNKTCTVCYENGMKQVMPIKEGHQLAMTVQKSRKQIDKFENELAKDGLTLKEKV